MRIASGSNTYQWIGDWAQIPDNAEARSGWAHPGVVVTRDGSVITFHQSDPTVLVYDQNERHYHVILHGLTLHQDV